MVSFEGEALSTRKGNMVLLEDLLSQAVTKARDIIEEKSPNLENKDEVARQVGIGAVVYTDLSNNRIKDIDFRWDRALNFDGESGPYVQYTHARCCSVLRKAPDFTGVTPDWSALTDDEAQALLPPAAHQPLPGRHPRSRRQVRAQHDHPRGDRHRPGVQQVLLRAPDPGRRTRPGRGQGRPDRRREDGDQDRPVPDRYRSAGTYVMRTHYRRNEE